MEKMMKKYPYIGKGAVSATVVMMFKPKHGVTIDSKTWATSTGAVESKINEDYFKNITHEYLQNTYGEVQSPEHAEFINLLSINHGLTGCTHELGDDVFWFEGVDLYFGKKDFSGACTEDKKQITIPLPPKADKQELSEWPQVESIVTWGSGHAGVVKSLPDEFAWVKRSDNSQYVTLYISSLKKPKAPEQELRDHIVHLIDESKRAGTNSYALALSLMDQLDIKKKPQ